MHLYQNAELWPICSGPLLVTYGGLHLSQNLLSKSNTTVAASVPPCALDKSPPVLYTMLNTERMLQTHLQKVRCSRLSQT